MATLYSCSLLGNTKRERNNRNENERGACLFGNEFERNKRNEDDDDHEEEDEQENEIKLRRKVSKYFDSQAMNLWLCQIILFRVPMDTMFSRWQANVHTEDKLLNYLYEIIIHSNWTCSLSSSSTSKVDRFDCQLYIGWCNCTCEATCFVRPAANWHAPKTDEKLNECNVSRRQRQYFRQFNVNLNAD